ncbi:DinB family protein [Chitinophagaceae bacterium 26-R-25]|nr:DinB family protein [Chitinophagaceae bacterium 26-R-25]
MKLQQLIAQHILDVHNGVNWTEVNIADTLKDVSFEMAVKQTKASKNTIASLLYHLTFYNDVMLKRLKGKPPVINDANGFDMPPLSDEAAWLELKEKNMASANALAEAIQHIPDEKLFEPILPGFSQTYKSLHGIAEHAHYHLGQMVLLKNLIRS